VPGLVWLADAARALTLVNPGSDEQLDATMQVLGLQRRHIAEAVVGPPRTPVEAAPPSRRPTETAAQHIPDDDEPPIPAEAPDPGPEPDLPLLDPIGHENVAVADPYAPALPRPTPRSAPPPMPHEPLLSPRSATAILRTTLSRGTDSGDLDVEAVVEHIARSQPIEDLPRRRLRSMRFGVDVLVDRGTAMQPFARDQAEIVNRIRRLVGRELTTVRSFADSPMRGCGDGPSHSWQPYQPPYPGTKVLILSDLGIGGPALNPHRSSTEEWCRFARVLRQQACEPVALVPYPPHRWPTTLTALFPLICWDRSTTTGGAFTATGGL
jgi:hypothetical protein